MLTQGILVAVVYFICCTLSWFGLFHFNRPIIIAPLIGLVLGDFRAGLILGASFETVFLGIVAIGGSVPADPAVGTAIGTAFAILSNLDSESALALAIPVSIAGLMLMGLPIMLINPMFYNRMLKRAAEGKAADMEKYPVISGLITYIFPSIIIGMAVTFGVDAISFVFATLPIIVMAGLGVAGGILPALGIALMLNMLFDSKIVIFFFLGFVITKYLELPSIVLAIIAISIGLFAFALMPRNETAPAHAVANADVEEDFFT